MIKAVFFDLDETLIDAHECHGESNIEAFKLFGLDYGEVKEKSRHVDTVGTRVVDFLKLRLRGAQISEEQVPLGELVEKREKIFLELVSRKAKLLPGAREALRSCKQAGLIVAIISSGTRRYIRHALSQFKLDRYSDFIVGAEDSKRGKPYPDCYLRAFGQLPKNTKKKSVWLLRIQLTA